MWFLPGANVEESLSLLHPNSTQREQRASRHGLMKYEYFVMKGTKAGTIDENNFIDNDTLP
jgi:hypothetical protein